MKIPLSLLPEIRSAYEDDCIPMVEIASWFGVGRVAICRFLKKHGVETRKGFAARRKIVCDGCGVEYEINRARYRAQVLNGGSAKHFCSDVCYFVYLENSGSLVNRHKQRIARMKVSKVFDLKPEHVVHHKDGNHHNTMLSNFMVFANQSDHIRFHHQERQGEVTVMSVWDGF